jgi:hypothetical protein
MDLPALKQRLESNKIYYSEDTFLGNPGIIGYDKKFKWRWLATQLNTFVIAIDYGDQPISVETLESALDVSFAYAKKHYNGWPRGIQSGIAVITLLISSNIDTKSIAYCQQLKSGKKWAGFTIPVTIDSTDQQAYFFSQYPIWGRIYYPYFKDLISKLIT